MSDSPKEHPTHAPIELPEDEKVISQEEVHEDAARQLSEEQEKLVADMALPAELAQHLVMNVPEFGQLVASMLASRQLYAMCMYEMDMLCDRTDFKGMGIEEIDTAALEDFQVPMLKEILINSAAVQAQQPFDEKLLFNGFVKTVFPWMQNVVVDHTKQQEEASKKSLTK